MSLGQNFMGNPNLGPDLTGNFSLRDYSPKGDFRPFSSRLTLEWPPSAQGHFYEKSEFRFFGYLMGIPHAKSKPDPKTLFLFSVAATAVLGRQLFEV